MSSAWLLPEHLSDVLPVQARRLEELRRKLLDRAHGYGYELVAPPLLEHLESLLTGTGHALDLRTFKLVDQLSGRTLGLRADTTPQAARIDAHLLNRDGVTRLCYCGPVLHTRPAGLYASREPLQLGAELFGHAGLEADLEIQELALDCLLLADVREPYIDLADARLLRALLAGVMIDVERIDALAQALSNKDAATVGEMSAAMPDETRGALQALVGLYGDGEVLAAARAQLPRRPMIDTALDQLEWLATHLQRAHPALRVGFDLSDYGGYTYYSGARFTVFASGATDPLVRGGRYDEVGAVFGRNRPAAGFSMDLKALVDLGTAPPSPPAIRAPWGEDEALRRAVRALRDDGEVVAWALPGQGAGLPCDRELVRAGDMWAVRALGAEDN